MSKINIFCKYAVALAGLFGFASTVTLPSMAMDTDIFGATASSAAPNVLIVLDNTANWSRENQKFPDGKGGTITQGQAETAAIRSVLDALEGVTNIGLMSFATAGTANDTGGYLRQAIKPMSSIAGSPSKANKETFQAKLDTIYNDINGTREKINAGTPYGDLMWDAYSYFSGGTPSVRSAAVDTTRADADAYTSLYTRFNPPVSADNICAANHIIFIGNPPARGPTLDSNVNNSALTAANGAAVDQLGLPPFIEVTANVPTKLGYSSACYSTAPSGTVTDAAYSSVCPGGANAIYDSCIYNGADSSTTMNACPVGQSRYNVLADVPNSGNSSSVVGASETKTETTTLCYASPEAASSDSILACPAPTTVTSGSTTTTTTYACTYSRVAAANCGSTSVVGATLTQTGTTAICYSGITTGNDKWSNSTDYASLTCPMASSVVSGTSTINTSYNCTYAGTEGPSTGCASRTYKVNVSQFAVPTTTTSGLKTYTVTRTATPTVTTSTLTSGSITTTLGNSAQCYSSAPAGTPTEYACPAGATCSYGGTTTDAMCPSGKVYGVTGNLNTIITAPTGGTRVTDTATYNADEWAHFMNTKGFNVAGTSSQAQVRTHTVDVYGAQPNGVQSSLLSNMSLYGGGGYYTATNPDQLAAALKSIFSQINATNSAFASAALPISATQRAQNANQVYIGVFRPDQQSMPRWMGNLKRFALGNVNSTTDLVDVNEAPAINTSTGLFDPCSVSYWTKDSGDYWASLDEDSGVVSPTVFFTRTNNTDPGNKWDIVGNNTALAKGGCLLKADKYYSDAPDGSIVEKGGAAQQMRLATTRNMLTLSGANMVKFNATNVTISSNATINANIVNFISGTDVTGELGTAFSTAFRPSIHGAVIHSRPQPVDFGPDSGVKIYYGSNDGTFRGVDAQTGKEDWAFVAPESFGALRRLMDNTPVVSTPSPPGTTPLDFYFDGSTGLYQSAIGTGSKTWIYPAMRRGGRMLYAFDVSNPASDPVFKWKTGCPNQSNDTDCSTGMADIGQTWSTPAVVFLSKYSTTNPVIVVGGGYSTCEDADVVSPACTSPKGAAIYVLDAITGALIKSFPTLRSVPADVSLIDVNFDGKVDFAYAADTGGNIYRINFSDPTTLEGLPPTSSVSTEPQWNMVRVAYTNDTSNPRKFLFAPALLAATGKVFVAIASGDREHPTDQSYPFTNPILNRAYVYSDDLISAPYDLDTSTNNITADNTCTAPGLLGSTRKSWFLNLNAYGKGEQAVTSALISAGVVFFSTNRPFNPNDKEYVAACGAGLGQARGYALNLFNGSGAIKVNPVCGGDRSDVFVGGGLPPSPVTGVVNVGGVIQNVLIGAVKLDGTSSTPFGGQKLNPSITQTRSRIYWKTNADSK